MSTREEAAFIFPLLYASYACYVYNRKSVSQCLPSLINTDGLSPIAAGVIVSSQNTAYAISKLACGITSDYVNPRSLLSYGLLCCAATTFFFSYNTEWDNGYVFLWFLNGCAQGVGWPAYAKILQTTFPSRFGTLWSVLSTSANVAGIVSPILSSYLIPVVGWRWNLRAVSAISAVGGLACLVCLKDNQSEEIAKDDKKSEAASSSKGKLTDLLLSPSIWLICVFYFVVNCVKTALIDWSQIFLVNQYKLPNDLVSRFVSSIELGGFVGSIAAGYLTDYFIQYKSKKSDDADPIRIRILYTLFCAVGVSISLHLLCFYVDTGISQVFLLLLGVVLGSCVYSQIVIYGIAASEMVPRNFSGASHSIVALAANLGAITAGFPLANLADLYDWKTAFTSLESVSVLIVIAMMLTINVFKVKSKSS